MSTQIILPAIILLMAFLLKLFIDRTASVADVCLSLLELPVDIAFLAMSLIAGFTIANPDQASKGLITFAAYVVVAVLVVVFWRRSRRYFTTDKNFIAVFLGVLNTFVCVAGLVYAVWLLSG